MNWEGFAWVVIGGGVASSLTDWLFAGDWRNWLSEAERNDPGLTVSQRKRKLVEKVFLDEARPAASDRAARTGAGGLATSVGRSRT